MKHFVLVFAATASILAACQPLIRDAHEYSEHQQVGLGEAVSQLALQDEIGQLNAVLEANEQDTFAGLWIQHEPDYRIIVAFTKNGQKTIRSYIENKPWAGLVKVRPAKYTYEELQAAQRIAHSAVHQFCIDVESAIDVTQNRVELYVYDPRQVEAALQPVGIQLPASVTLIQVNEMSSMTALLAGELVLVDGCLRAKNPDADVSDVLILPPKYTLRMDGSTAEIITKDGQVVAHIGDRVDVGEGEIPVEAMDQCMFKKLPTGCLGPYWFVGSISLTGRPK